MTKAATTPNQTTDVETVPAGTTLEQLKDIVQEPVVAEPGMPAIGERVLLSAVYGRMVHPVLPSREDELDVNKITKATFDWWHEMQWKAGKIRHAVI